MKREDKSEASADLLTVDLLEAAPNDDEQLLELLLSHTAESPVCTPRIDGVVIGRLAAIASDGVPLVSCLSAERVRARTTAHLDEEHIDHEVALVFENGDPNRPIVVGLLHRPRPAAATTASTDGERLVLSARREIELRCGKASITLTRAGKILLRGAYVSTHASGLNRIKGAAVRIN